MNQQERDLIDPQGARNREAIENTIEITAELAESNPLVEQDAAEFGIHEKQRCWRLGLLVARSVDPTGKGGRQTTSSKKISIRAFSRLSGMDRSDSVKRHLDAWDAAAEDGLVPSSFELVPGQSVDFDEHDEHTPEKWNKYFKAKARDRSPKTLLQACKPLDQFDDQWVRDWIRRESFEGQSEFSLQEMYNKWAQVNRIACKAMDEMVRVANELEYQVVDGDEE